MIKLIKKIYILCFPPAIRQIWFVTKVQYLNLIGCKNDAILKWCNLGINRTAKNQSDRKDYQWFKNVYNKPDNGAYQIECFDMREFSTSVSNVFPGSFPSARRAVSFHLLWKFRQERQKILNIRPKMYLTILKTSKEKKIKKWNIEDNGKINN